ncbi:MAG: UvrB/UvrC motif-containing protein [Minisyncoccia bacterium]
MRTIVKKLAKMPSQPGIYLFKNSSGEIIYIGKSGHLKNRVRSYFSHFAKVFDPEVSDRRASRDKQKVARFFSPTKNKMLQEIADVEIIKTESEIAALIKESELIKKHKPKFNVLMRDSKNYLYVGFSKEEFPKIILTHQPQFLTTHYKLLTTHYIGPFTDGTAVRKSLHILREIFPYCTCKQKHNVKCLNGHLGRCLTFCCLKKTSAIPRAYDRKLAVLERYKGNIRAIKSILSGRSQVLLKELKKEIKQAIKLQNFENAQELKNKIMSLDEVLKHARVLTEKPEVQSPAIFKDDRPDFKLLGLKSNPQRIETYDISNLHGQAAVGSMVVFELKNDGSYRPNKNEYRKFKIKTVSGSNDPAMLAEVIKRRLNNNWPWPQLIIVDGGRTQLNAALKSLGSKKIRIIGLAKRLEEIYLPERPEPVLAQKFGQSLKHLFQAIRDEAHRFALSYHHKLRHKTISGTDLTKKS